MFSIAILSLLGAFCIIVGFILFVVGGFRVSWIWGLIVLFLPFLLSFAFAVLGGVMGFTTEIWWIAASALVPLLPWFAFMSMHWDKAKNGFLLYVAGIVFFAAAFFTIDGDKKQTMAVAALTYSAKSGQPLPPAFSDWLGIKKPGDKSGVPGSPDAKTDATGATPAKPGTDSASAAAPVAPVSLETEADVNAAVAELHDRAAKLKARKDMLRGSTDQVGISALAEDIKQFNERLKVVTARQVELKMIPAPPPTPTPGPVIPPTVVIPPATPTPPTKKK